MSHSFESCLLISFCWVLYQRTKGQIKFSVTLMYCYCVTERQMESRSLHGCLFLGPFIRHALVSVPFGVAHSRPLAGTSLRSCALSLRSLRGFPPKRYAFLRRIWRPFKQASRLRSRLCKSCRREIHLTFCRRVWICDVVNILQCE